ncbi:YtxH domain-containing protein [Larkinella knui]|uniref:YtxH domain-containing protein n=1 Tax=Larkinella knui TaxID=2025310 RepID=A0A3P1CPU3_9BACT|nr:YtxH domain-containing protein [Larkinella knui]RRB15342.1 YtxH domain-containing protein [Larkinella knui]
MKTEKVVLSILLAATTGVALGLLFAPDKGVRVRRKIKEKGEDYLEGLKDDYSHSVKSFKKKVDAVYDDITAKMKGFAEESKEAKS